MLRKDEEIISSLEELDSTFSQINRVLKHLKRKVEAAEESNKALVRDCDAWGGFFGAGACGAGATGDVPDVPGSIDTQSFLGHSSPANPFCRVPGADAKRPAAPDHSLADDSLRLNDSPVSELADFDPQLLPDGFREIGEIKMIYRFIEKRRSVPIDEVYERFGDVSRELVDIVLDVLVRKNFVRLGENRLEV